MATKPAAAAKKREIVNNQDGLFIPTERIPEVRAAVGEKNFDKAVREAGLDPKDLASPGFGDIIVDTWGSGWKGKVTIVVAGVGAVTLTLTLVEGGFRLAGSEGPLSWLAHKLVG